MGRRDFTSAGIRRLRAGLLVQSGEEHVEASYAVVVEQQPYRHAAVSRRDDFLKDQRAREIVVLDVILDIELLPRRAYQHQPRRERFLGLVQQVKSGKVTLRVFVIDLVSIWGASDDLEVLGPVKLSSEIMPMERLPLLQRSTSKRLWHFQASSAERTIRSTSRTVRALLRIRKREAAGLITHAHCKRPAGGLAHHRATGILLAGGESEGQFCVHDRSGGRMKLICETWVQHRTVYAI